MSINKLIVLYLQWSLNFDSWWIKIWFKFINSSQFSTVLACFIKKEQTRMLNDKKMTRWKRVKKMWLDLCLPPSAPWNEKTIKQQWNKTRDSCCNLVHHTGRMLYQKVSKENKLISSSTLICNLFSNNLDLNPIEIL